MLQLIGIFSPPMKEVVEMFYLTEEPVILSGEKYEKEIGPLPRTSYRAGLEETILWMQQKEDNTYSNKKSAIFQESIADLMYLVFIAEIFV